MLMGEAAVVTCSPSMGARQMRRSRDATVLLSSHSAGSVAMARQRCQEQMHPRVHTSGELPKNLTRQAAKSSPEDGDRRPCQGAELLAGLLDERLVNPRGAEAD